jgi:ankyrin repeat protein
MERKHIYLSIALMVVGIIIISLNAYGGTQEDLNEALLKAVNAKNISRVEVLLSKGADINTIYKEDPTYTPLGIACRIGDIKMVDFLISKGANPHGHDLPPNAPMYHAIHKNHPVIVSKLLDLGISSNYAWPNRDGGTLLTNAISWGHMEVVKLLVTRGADVNFCGNGPYSPLYRSIIHDRFSIFKFLSDHGAFLNEQDRNTLAEIKWGKSKQDKKYVQILKGEGRGKRDEEKR